MGYNLFDCVIPTRDARHNRLYVYSDGGYPDGVKNFYASKENFYEYYYPADEKHRRGDGPVSNVCDCLLSKNYSRAYLRHLLASNDPTGIRLSTIHNLRFYTMLMEAFKND